MTNGINAAEGLEGAEVLESDVDVLLADLARSSEVNRAKTSSSSRKASGFFGLLPLPASQSSEAHDLQGINPGRVHRTIQVLRERLRAAERERDDAAEQLFAAIKRADEREAEGKVVEELKHQLAEAGKRVDFGERKMID